MAENYGRKPDYRLGVLAKGTEHRGQVGAAWKQTDGTIRIKLNAFVVLSAIDDLVLTLFINDDKPFQKKSRAQPFVGEPTPRDDEGPPF